MTGVTRAPLLPVYRLGLVAWFALTTLQLIWHAWLAPPVDMPMWLVLIISVVPLLLPLGALRDVRRALLWVGTLSLFYFCHGVSEAWSAPATRVMAIVEIVLTLVLIGALGAGVKRKSPEPAAPQ
jgi:uncharacterized membrane protein